MYIHTYNVTSTCVYIYRFTHEHLSFGDCCSGCCCYCHYFCCCFFCSSFRYVSRPFAPSVAEPAFLQRSRAASLNRPPLLLLLLVEKATPPVRKHGFCEATDIPPPWKKQNFLIAQATPIQRNARILWQKLHPCKENTRILRGES